MKRAWPMVLLLSLSVLSIAARSPRVRPQSDHMADLVQLAAKRSPTVAGLLKMIEASDVILQVEFRLDNTVPRAATQLVTSAGLVRYVRTYINPRLPTRRRIELLGHELQHVVEIATDPSVRDDASMRARFTAIGWVSDGAASYETAAAIAVERQVRNELSAPGTRRP
ncbi:MAG TPA: hypothetical protein PKW63_14710 [Vicinamibacterales bacterium]|nr:hypothetical protein [Vicinamibacterales bacterium]